MPQVELTLTSIAMASFVVKRVVEFDDEQWRDMDREEREAAVIMRGEAFLRDNVDWDYKVL